MQLGLIGNWPEFFEPASDMLKRDYTCFPHEYTRLVENELAWIVWILLNRYREQLSPEQLQELRDYRDGHRKLPILSSPEKVSPAIKPTEEMVSQRRQPFASALPKWRYY